MSPVIVALLGMAVAVVGLVLWAALRTPRCIRCHHVHLPGETTCLDLSVSARVPDHLLRHDDLHPAV